MAGVSQAAVEKQLLARARVAAGQTIIHSERMVHCYVLLVVVIIIVLVTVIVVLSVMDNQKYKIW